MTPGKAPVAIAWNEDDCVNVWPGHDLRDEERSNLREVAPPALLPRGHKRPRSPLVDKRGTRASEGETSAPALGTPAYGPRARSTTELTPGRNTAHERPHAALTGRLADPATDATTDRYEHVSQLHPTDVRRLPVTAVCRLRAISVPYSGAQDPPDERRVIAQGMPKRKKRGRQRPLEKNSQQQ